MWGRLRGHVPAIVPLYPLLGLNSEIASVGKKHHASWLRRLLHFHTPLAITSYLIFRPHPPPLMPVTSKHCSGIIEPVARGLTPFPHDRAVNQPTAGGSYYPIIPALGLEVRCHSETENI